MKMFYKILETFIFFIAFVLVFFSIVLTNSAYYIPAKKYEEILLLGRNLLISEIILFLFYNHLYQKPNPMKTSINFYKRVKSLGFLAPIFMFITFIAIYYTFGFMELYQEKDLGIFFGTLYYFGVLIGFVSIFSFTFLTYQYANDNDEDSGIPEDTTYSPKVGGRTPKDS